MGSDVRIMLSQNRFDALFGGRSEWMDDGRLVGLALLFDKPVHVSQLTRCHRSLKEWFQTSEPTTSMLILERDMKGKLSFLQVHFRVPRFIWLETQHVSTVVGSLLFKLQPLISQYPVQSQAGFGTNEDGKSICLLERLEY